MRRTWSLVLATLLLAAASVQAGTLGRLVGTITDNQEVALPGVTVTVSSERLLGGPQVAVTDERGGFMLHFLPVGVYTVAAALDGFVPVTAEVRVGLDRTASVELTMVPARFEGSVEVTAEVPLVDTRQVGTQVVMDQTFLERAAVGMDGRDFLSLMTTLPGVAGGATPSVYGSTSSDNRYLLDGLSITDPAFGGLWRLPVNRDAIDELAVHTGGFEAEYGQGVGAVVNVVTRSGGNDFTGTLDARYRDERLVEEGEHFDRDAQASSRRVLSATLGGPVLRDRLWFFAAVDSTVDRHQDEGAPVPYDDETRSWFGKLSWQVGASRLVLKGSSWAQTIDGFNSSRFITASASKTQQVDFDVWQLESSSVLSDRALLEAQVGSFWSPGEEYPTSASRDTVGHYNLDTEVLSEAAVWVAREDTARDELRLAVSLFAEGAGDHELKLGADYQRLGYELQGAQPGGMQAQDRIPPPGFVDLNGDGFYTQQVYEMTMDD